MEDKLFGSALSAALPREAAGLRPGMRGFATVFAAMRLLATALPPDVRRLLGR